MINYTKSLVVIANVDYVYSLFLGNLLTKKDDEIKELQQTISDLSSVQVCFVLKD